MPYFFTTLIQAGPRRKIPAGSDSQAGANWILLDTDRALLWLPSSIVDARLRKLADHEDEPLAVAARSAFSELSDDRNYRAADSVRGTIGGLLRNAPAGRWGSLRPSKVRQRYEVWLGPGNEPLWSEPAFVGPNSKTFVDNFNRTAGNLNGSTSSDGLFTWAEVDGSEFNTNGTQCDFSPPGEFNTAQAAANLDTDDHYAQVVRSGYTRSGGQDLTGGVIVRFSGGSGYSFEVGVDASATRRVIKRYDNDASIAEDATGTTDATIRMEVDGSSLTGKINGATVLGPSTNTQFTGQLRCGIVGFGTAGTDFQFDDFQCGDLVVEPPPVLQPLAQRATHQSIMAM